MKDENSSITKMRFFRKNCMPSFNSSHDHKITTQNQFQIQLFGIRNNLVEYSFLFILEIINSMPILLEIYNALLFSFTEDNSIFFYHVISNHQRCYHENCKTYCTKWNLFKEGGGEIDWHGGCPNQWSVGFFSCYQCNSIRHSICQWGRPSSHTENSGCYCK